MCFAHQVLFTVPIGHSLCKIKVQHSAVVGMNREMGMGVCAGYAELRSVVLLRRSLCMCICAITDRSTPRKEKR